MMVAYSFKPRFAEPILRGIKRQTIRAARRRHARPGEQVQLYTGMRTARCKLITRARCIATAAVRLNFPGEDVLISEVRGDLPATHARHLGSARPTPPGVIRRRWLDEFVRADGFADWSDMRTFWRDEHAAREFNGILIVWERADQARIAHA